MVAFLFMKDLLRDINQKKIIMQVYIFIDNNNCFSFFKNL